MSRATTVAFRDRRTCTISLTVHVERTICLATAFDPNVKTTFVRLRCEGIVRGSRNLVNDVNSERRHRVIDVVDLIVLVVRSNFLKRSGQHPTTGTRRRAFGAV